MAIRIAGRELAESKRYYTGTHRSRSPADTLRDYARFMKPLGITRLANITGLDCIGLPVYVALRPASRSLVTSQGKGIDAPSAKVSALMESIEAWHGEYIDRALRFESSTELRRRADVIDVMRVPRYVGSRVDHDTPSMWIEGYDVAQQRPVWVPYEAVTINFVWPPDHAAVFMQSTNGLASGNHLLEAISHALCELIERDGMALWTKAVGGEGDRRRLDPGTIDDPECVELLARLERAGVGAVLWDMTTDLGIPIYGCEIYELGDRARWRRLGIYGGYGCHLAPGIAMSRAISEAIQSRLAYIAGTRDDLFHEDYEQVTARETTDMRLAALRDTPLTRSFTDRPSLATPTFEGDVDCLLAALRAAGFDSVVVVDLTKEELGIPVVKVIVPGLEVGLPHAQPGSRAGAR